MTALSFAKMFCSSCIGASQVKQGELKLEGSQMWTSGDVQTGQCNKEVFRHLDLKR